MTKARPCAQCRAPVEDGNVHAPFCSNRCKMLDLGAWLTESYRVPVGSADEDDDGDAAQAGVPSRGPGVEQ